jgi:hypothetical protein
MTRFAMARSLIALMVVLGLGAFLPGCGGGPSGGGGIPFVPPTVSYPTPQEDPSKPGSVGGTLFTLYRSVIDYPTGARVILSGVKAADGGPYQQITYSTARGTYRFDGVPAGTYDVTALATSTTITETNVDPPTYLKLTGTVSGVKVRGNLPTLMANILVGVAAETINFHGTITQHGLPAVGAIVTADVSAYTTDALQGNTMDKVSVLLTTTTGADGRYQIVVPSSGLSYYIAAHSSTSAMSESPKMTNLQAGGQQVDLILDDAVTPAFGTLQLDIISTTLPAPTDRAREQTAIAQVAVARALHAPAERIARLEKLALTRPSGTRGIGSLVENDVYWSILDSDRGVLGFDVFRTTDPAGAFNYVGSVADPYLLFFFDSDPGLTPGTPYSYTVTSVAANGAMSPASRSVTATPLAPIGVDGPADGATQARADAKVTWLPVDGARCYLVLIYSDMPSYNMAPRRTPLLYLNGETTESFSDLGPGTYWWSVSAYNAEDPNYATAATYSAFRKLTIE